MIQIKPKFQVALLFIFSIILRLFNLFEIGLYHWDSGYFVGTALWLINQGGLPYPWDPPLYSFFVSISFLVFGIFDWAAILVSGLFGSLTVIVTYLVARELFNHRIAIVSSFILAINQIHITYSRLALSDITFTFFFTLSILFFILAFKTEKLRFYVLHGISLGMSQNTKYNGFMAFLIPFSFLIAYYIYSKYFKNKTGFKIFPVIKGMSISFILMSLLHLPWIFALGFGGEGDITSSTLTSLFEQSSVGFASIFFHGIELYFNIFSQTKANLLVNLENPLFYVTVFLFWVTPLVLVCFLFGFFGIMKKEKMFIIIWFLFILGFFSLGYKAVRVILPAIPAFSILSAVGLINISRYIHLRINISQKQILYFIIAIIFLTSIPSLTYPIGNVHDGYREAGNFLENNIGSDQYLYSFTGPQIRFYYPNASWWKLCENVSSDKIEYIILDYKKYIFTDDIVKDIQNIQDNSELIYEYENNIVELTALPLLLEGKGLKSDFRKISIYKISNKQFLRFFERIRENSCKQLI